MKIRVLPRIFFEKIKGTAEEDRLLESYRIISINSSRGDDSLPPFSERNRNHRNLLCIFQVNGKFVASDEIVIQRYIGAEDRNGKKIYEGDFLLTNEGSWRGNETFPVREHHGIRT